MQAITLELKNEAATLQAGARLGAVLEAGLSIQLHGDLGAGKTTFVRGLLHHLGHSGKVKSPTYTLVEPYTVAGLDIYHFDLYRFTDADEWEAAGFRDYFNAQSVCLVEWPQQAGDLLPQADIEVNLSPQGNGRLMTLSANTQAGKKCLELY